MKTFIKNRHGKQICVLIENGTGSAGLVFVMHGLSGSKDQPHISMLAQPFKEKDFVTVSFDATNSYGESEGEYADATITNFFEDLEDVIAWSATQSWYQEPFFLMGHSLGGISTILYAEKYPERVKGLAPISTVISGKLSMESHDQKALQEWEKTGWLIQESKTRPGLIKKLKWNHMVDRLQYDTLPEAHKLTMPTLLIVGEADELGFAPHQKLLFEKLPGKKELHFIKGASHTFFEEKHFSEIQSLIKNWIDTINV